MIDSLGGIDMDPINNNRVGASSPVEYVSPETKKEYEDLLEEVNKILKKNGCYLQETKKKDYIQCSLDFYIHFLELI